jgi:Ran GTPase-activating protein (RanGAP) involved in mRNA processing and transport
MAARKSVPVIPKLSKQCSDENVWRESSNKVYDGDEGRDQYWAMFRTGRRTDYGRKTKGAHERSTVSPTVAGDPSASGGDPGQAESQNNAAGNDEDAPPASPRSAYLLKMEEFNLRPERIQFKKETTQLLIQNYGLGDRRMEAFSVAISHFPYELVNISNNRLTSHGVEHVCRHLSDGCYTLDVSGNNVGAVGVGHIARYVLNPPPACVRHELMALNLASCKLGNDGARALAEGMGANNPHLKRLMLANNGIGEDACMALCTGLLKCPALEELDISWNNIDLAAAALIKQLKALQWLDISSNSLGSQSAMDQSGGFISAAQANDGSAGSMALMSHLAKAIADNEALVHLNLSHNQFTARQLQLLAKSLNSNHTIIDLHLSHPQAYIDAHGFMHVITGSRGGADDPTHLAGGGGGGGGGGAVGADAGAGAGAGGATAPGSPGGADGGGGGGDADNRLIGGGCDRGAGDKPMGSQWNDLPPVLLRRNIFASKTCWISAGYSQHRFKLDVPKAGPGGLAKRAGSYGVYLHLNIDAFRGERMDLLPDTSGGSSTTQSYALHRMVPPGKLYFFFTVAEDEPPVPAPVATPAPAAPVDGRASAAVAAATPATPKRGYTVLCSDANAKKPWTSWAHKAAIVALGQTTSNLAPNGLVPKEVNVQVVGKHMDQPVQNTHCWPRVLNGEIGHVFKPNTWSLQNSIFAARLRESDARSFYTQEVRRRD